MQPKFPSSSGTADSGATNKRLLPMFESSQRRQEQDDSVLESKRVKSTLASTPNSSNIPKETTVLPHETPIAKYLRLPTGSNNTKTPDDYKAAGSTTTTANTPVIITPKRYGYLDWDDYFLGIAILSSKRSKDPDHAEGACIVDANNRIVAIGYSGFTKGCPDTIFPWSDYNNNNKQQRDDNNLPWLHSKQPYVCPAINNAILNKCSQDVAGCRLYVMEFPSSDCVKVMIQSGIQEIVILKPFEKSNNTISNGNSSLSSETDMSTLSDDQQASRIMLEMANIQVRYHQPAISSINLDFSTVADVAYTESKEQEKTNCNDCNCSKSTSVQLTDEEQFAMTILQEEANYNASAVKDNGRRTNYLSWDDYFMGVAFLTAQRSKDPNTQVGACIVDNEHRIIGLGCKFVMACSFFIHGQK
jgi:dCMP deaminase